MMDVYNHELTPFPKRLSTSDGTKIWIRKKNLVWIVYNQ